jgi:hypothetical protein
MPVPEFNMYYPSEDAMDRKQATFYKVVEASLQKGEYIDIEGNIGYVFTYLYKLLSKWNKSGFESLSEFLIYVSEIYKHEKKLSDYCLFWAYDCLLGLKKYDIYLEKTEPRNPFGTSTHASNLRLNIHRKLGMEADPIDILLMVGGRKNKFITGNQGIYKEKIKDVFLSFSQEKGNWFNIFEEWNYSRKSYPHMLFNGAVVPKNPEMEFPIYAYYSAYEKLNLIKDLAKEAENFARKEMGVPQIGEGWVSETELFRKLEAEFSITTVIQHGQPKWLGRQHFDIWFPNWKIAVEYHGKQHFEPVDFFGGTESFDKTVERDLRKTEIAKRNGVKLIVVAENYDLERLIQEIRGITIKRKISAPNA